MREAEAATASTSHIERKSGRIAGGRTAAIDHLDSELTIEREAHPERLSGTKV
jgi:hypothetical protein